MLHLGIQTKVTYKWPTLIHVAIADVIDIQMDVLSMEIVLYWAQIIKTFCNVYRKSDKAFVAWNIWIWMIYFDILMQKIDKLCAELTFIFDIKWYSYSTSIQYFGLVFFLNTISIISGVFICYLFLI